MTAKRFRVFADLAARDEKALIAYTTAGYPEPAATVPVICALAEAGADIIELGLPFSDPLADGPVIQATAARALGAGFRLVQLFEQVAAVRAAGYETPIVFLVYYNTVLNMGEERFVKEAARSGVDGLVIPDLPFEESKSLRDQAAGREVAVISMVAPTTTGERLVRLCRQARGFIYLVSVTGVTGIREEVSSDLAGQVNRMRAYTDTPIAVGFGLANRRQVAHVCRFADGAIVGSAILKQMDENRVDGRVDLAALQTFVRDLKAGTRQF